MRRAKWLALLLAMILMIFSAGCGSKSAEDIVGDLEDMLTDVESYSAVGTMTIQTGETPQEYQVEVWYKQPQYYRILLNNVQSQVTQIVLKNDDGVFVLDPALNKSFRFKSDWPETQGQVYLFQSLAKSIVDDQERTFLEEGDGYLFEVKANYQNQNLAGQKVWLDSDLHPVKVEIFDPNKTQLVEMVFTQFEFGVEFEDDAFDMERNMTGWDSTLLPAMAEVDNTKSFGIIEPSYTPEGVAKQSIDVVAQEDTKKVVIKYTGDYYYTLIESRPEVKSASSAPESAKTDLVDLGFGLGIMTEMSQTRSLSWNYDGVEFMLSGDLPAEEMVKVAQSVFAQPGK